MPNEAVKRNPSAPHEKTSSLSLLIINKPPSRGQERKGGDKNNTIKRQNDFALDENFGEKKSSGVVVILVEATIAIQVSSEATVTTSCMRKCAEELMILHIRV